MKCKYDGELTEYWFGDREHSGDTWKFTSDSLAKAIRAFRVSALYPHQYVAYDFRIPAETVGSEGYTKTVYLSSKRGAYIPISVYDRDPETNSYYKEVARIAPEGPEAEDFTLSALPPGAKAQLNASENLGDQDSTALAKVDGVFKHIGGIDTADRQVIEQKMLELNKMRGNLERQRRELYMQVQVMEAEIQKRQDNIWVIELFLGCKEEVKQIAKGKTASQDVSIAIHQQTLCMDEEVALWDWNHNPERLGEFDYQDLDDFDIWLVQDPERIRQFIPEEKGVVSFRVRRHEKDRGPVNNIAEAFTRVAEKEADRKTYILIRNGENLYRIWADINIWPRFFPRLDEFDHLNDTQDTWYDHNKDKAKDSIKRFIGGLMVVQGIIERSTLLHPIPEDVISIWHPSAPKYFTLVRDDERPMALTDGSELSKLTWESYEGWLQDQITVGCRILWRGQSYYRYKLEEHVDINTVYGWPDKGELYILDSRHKHSYRGHTCSFLYDPGDEVLKDDAWGYGGYYERRKKRVRFKTTERDLLPFDSLSWRVISHLLNNRRERKHYAKFFQEMFYWRKLKMEEEQRELPFAKLVLQRAGVSSDDTAELARVQRLIRWWKLKTKFHRDLATDEAKALRMIGKAYQRGDDYEDDPERALSMEEGVHDHRPKEVRDVLRWNHLAYKWLRDALDKYLPCGLSAHPYAREHWNGPTPDAGYRCVMAIQVVDADWNLLQVVKIVTDSSGTYLDGKFVFPILKCNLSPFEMPGEELKEF